MQTSPIYMLRRCLPLWKADAVISEAIAFCRRHHIGEVIWKIDPEDFNHGFTPEALQRQYVAKLLEAKRRLAAAGLVMSINPWLTQNHIDRNRYPGEPPAGYAWRICADGTVAREMACPVASPAWRQWLLKSYELYASVQPARLWIEDDFKTFSLNAGEVGCFCPAHLAAFGWEGSRQELAAQLHSDRQLRRRWMDFNAGILLELCRELEAVIHRVSPETRIGQMCSWSCDGRWWKEAGIILAGKHRPLARTSLAAYQEAVPVSALPDSFDIWKESACLPDHTENCPELENWPYGVYSKSAATTRLHILTAFASGAHSVTMNLYDMLGTPIGHGDRYARMLRDLHPFLQGWNRLRNASGRPKGIHIPFTPRFADDALDKNGNALFDGDKFAVPLQGAGLPVVLNCPDAPCAALTGNCVEALSDGELQKIFAKGVFVDGRAAMVLARRGYAELMGVEPGELCDLHTRQLSAEEDRMLLRKDAHGMAPYLTVNFITAGGATYVALKPLPETAVASVLVDNDRNELLPAWTLHANRLGGRVAVCTYDLNDAILPGFMSENRALQLRKIHRWLLGRTQAPEFTVESGGWKMPFLWEAQTYTLAGVINFDLDAMEEITLTLSARPDEELRFRQLLENGRLVPVSPDRTAFRAGSAILRFRQRLEYGHAALFKIVRICRKTPSRQMP